MYNHNRQWLLKQTNEPFIICFCFFFLIPFSLVLLANHWIGLQLECPQTTATALRSTLQIVKSPIQTLSLYDFDRTATSISSDMFINGIYIRNLKISNTRLTMLKDNCLQYLRTTLETLSITNSKLNQVSLWFSKS